MIGKSMVLQHLLVCRRGGKEKSWRGWRCTLASLCDFAQPTMSDKDGIVSRLTPWCEAQALQLEGTWGASDVFVSFHVLTRIARSSTHHRR